MKEGWGRGREEKEKKCNYYNIRRYFFQRRIFSEVTFIHSNFPWPILQQAHRTLYSRKLPKSWLQIIPCVGVQNENNVCIFSLSSNREAALSKSHWLKWTAAEYWLGTCFILTHKSTTYQYQARLQYVKHELEIATDQNTSPLMTGSPCITAFLSLWFGHS